MDYNIYIHSSGGGRENPTKPKKATGQTEPWKDDEEGENVVDFVKSMNPAKIVGRAINLLPFAAAAYSCVKVSATAMHLAHYFYETDTGDYHMRVIWENMGNQINRLFHPISTALQDWKNYHNEQLNDRKQAQYRDLLGDSYIGKYGRGV